MDSGLPNILIIICHDLGQQLGCYGDPSLRTHNLDRLAQEGVRFENHFCTTPLCSPSRGSIITGRYPHTNGLVGLAHRGFDLNEGEVTMAHYLKRKGYETHLFGFEHEAREPDIAKLGYEFLHRERPFKCANVTPQLLAFLQARAAKESPPFLAMTGYSEVHRAFDQEMYTPDDPEEVFIPPYLPDTPEVRLDLAQFHGLIHAVDECVGKIFKTLEEKGLAENTWVIFTTDHGIAFPRAKSTLYDPGIKTALLMRWPTRSGLPPVRAGSRGEGFAGGRVFRELISNIDLLPTILEATGAEVPESIQGKSFLALLQGRKFEPREEIFAEKTYHDIYDPIRAIRTTRFKYIRSFEKMPNLPLPSDIRKSLSARSVPEEFKGERPLVELYDLEADPDEMNNLVGNPEYAEVEKELDAMLTKWLEDTEDPILKGPISAPPGAKVG